MASAANRQKIMNKETDAEAGVVKLTFTEGGEVILVKLADLQQDVLKRAALHGLSQKIGDAAAGKKGDEAYEACMTVVERIQAGDWAKPSEGGEGARPSMVVEAIMRALTAAGKSPDKAKVEEKYAGKDSEEARKVALSNPQVKAAYETIRAERAAEKAKKAVEAANADGAPGLDSL